MIAGRKPRRLAEAKRDAIYLRTEMVDRAKQEVEKLQARSLRDMELAKRKAIHDLSDFATELSFRTARERLEATMSDADHERLVASALAEMGSPAGRSA